MQQEQEIDAIAYFEPWADEVADALKAIGDGFDTVNRLVDLIRVLHERLTDVERETAMLKAQLGIF